jgi:hypothetical protein
MFVFPRCAKQHDASSKGGTRPYMLACKDHFPKAITDEAGVKELVSVNVSTFMTNLPAVHAGSMLTYSRQGG